MLRLASAPRRAVRGRQRVLLQLRCRGQRGGAEDRPQGNGKDPDRRPRGRVPRSYARRPLGDRAAVEVGGLRAARSRSLVCPSERRRVARGRARAGRRHGAAAARARPRRGRGDPARAGVRAGGSRARARGRRAPLRRRGAGRDGPDGHVLRLRATRYPPRSRHSRQGPRERPADGSACSQASARRRGSCRATTARPSAATPSSPPRPCAVVEAIDDELLANVRDRGAQLEAGLAALPAVRSVRGRGLLIGAELDRPVGPVVDACREQGLLVLSAGPDVLRLTPPLVVDAAQVAEALATLERVLCLVNRRERQAAILRLVQDQALSTQAELVQSLQDEGHDVVQTTVSRDVAELGLVKVRAPSGRLIYAPPGTGDADRLRAIGAAMRRYATRRRGGQQRTRRRDDTVRVCERARPGDRRGKSPVDRRNARRRQHDLRGGEGRDDSTRAAGGARCLPRGGRYGMTLWSGKGRRLARSRGVGVPPRRRRPASPLRLRGDLPARAAASRGGAALRRRARRGGVEAGRDRAGSRRAISPRTRTSTARSSVSSATSAARSTPGARATTRSQPRSGSTSSTPAPRRERRSTRSRSSFSRSRRPRSTRSCPATPTFSAVSR